MSEPLLLIPGLLCDAALWQPQTDHLGGQVETLIGDTTRDDLVAGMASRILSAAPERFQLAALSMGGYVAFEILRRAPERVTRLALVDTQARPDTEEQRERRRALMKMAQVGRFKGVTPRLLPYLVSKAHLENADLVAIVIGMAERIGREGYLRQQNAILSRPDSRPLLPGIAVPTLVICGEEDILTPPDCAREMADGIPGARLEILPDCGHLAPLEQPDRVNALFAEFFAG